MNTEPTALAGTNQARRSIMAGLLTIALLAVAVTFIVDGALRAITILAAAAAIIAALRGLPDALIEIAGRKRGSTYFQTFSYIVPVASFILTVYLGWLFWRIQASELLGGISIELILLVIVAAALINLGVIMINAFASD